MKTGDILFCSSSKLLGRIIKRLTKSEFSHVALYVEVWGVPFVIDAQKDGIQFRMYSEWIEKYDYKVRVFRSNNEIDCKKISLRAASKAGFTGYDFESLIIRQPIKLLTGKWNEKKRFEEVMTCSEFVSWVYAIHRSYSMSPQDLYEWCIKNNFLEITAK